MRRRPRPRAVVGTAWIRRSTLPLASGRYGLVHDRRPIDRQRPQEEPAPTRRAVVGERRLTTTPAGRNRRTARTRKRAAVGSGPPSRWRHADRRCDAPARPRADAGSHGPRRSGHQAAGPAACRRGSQHNRARPPGAARQAAQTVSSASTSPKTSARPRGARRAWGEDASRSPRERSSGQHPRPSRNG